MGHFADFNFSPGSHGEAGRIRIEESWPEAGSASLGWTISRNSFIYLGPMGRQGGSGLKGGGPEAGGASLGWTISRNSILPVSHGETGRIRIEAGQKPVVPPFGGPF